MLDRRAHDRVPGAAPAAPTAAGAELRLLLLEDAATDAELVQAELRRAGLRFTWRRVEDRRSFLQELDDFLPDAILADYLLPQFSALEALELLRGRGAQVPFILVTGTQTEEIAVECMRAGADDYILKGSLTRLPAALLQALRKGEMEREKTRAEDELQQAQLQLLQAAKLESVGRLAAGVAHEVKNPLTTLLMGVEYLQRHLVDAGPEMVDVLRDMEEAVKRGNQVILGLLDFSAPRALELQQEKLEELIEESLALVKHECVKTRTTIVRLLAPDLPLLKLDRNKIEQVFVNLFLNAMQAMPEGGRLTVRAHATGRAETPARCQVMVQVEDTGVGIPAENLPRIFEPFFTTKRARRAAGLGLAVVRRIVDMHRGTIQVGNRTEGGVRVTLGLGCDDNDRPAGAGEGS